MTDIEIAHSIKAKTIKELAKKFQIKENMIEYYGKYRAKIDYKMIHSERKGNSFLFPRLIQLQPEKERQQLALG